MYSTSKWAVEPVQVPEPMEFPRMLLWKRTLLLGAIGIGIGLGGGYVLGRSMIAKTEPADSAPRTVVRMKFLPTPDTDVRFLPTPDADPGERTTFPNDGETFQTWMPPAADSPEGSIAEDLPPRRQGRPAIIRLENASPRNSDKG